MSRYLAANFVGNWVRTIGRFRAINGVMVGAPRPFEAAADTHSAVMTWNLSSVCGSQLTPVWGENEHGTRLGERGPF
jgi:hypothetical protein